MRFKLTLDDDDDENDETTIGKRGLWWREESYFLRMKYSTSAVRGILRYAAIEAYCIMLE